MNDFNHKIFDILLVDDVKIETYTEFYEITQKLSEEVKLNNKQISDYKSKLVNQTFEKSYEEFMQFDFSNNLIINNRISKPIFLNKAFKNKILECEMIKFPNIIPHIFKNLWLSNKIKFKDERVGLIMYNIIHHLRYFQTSSQYIYKKIKNYLNFFFTIYSNGEWLFEHHDNMGNRGFNNLVSAYNYFFIYKMKKYLGDYFVFSNTDHIFYLKAKIKKLDKTEVIKMVESFYDNILYDFTYNIDCLFLGYNQYLYVQDGQMKSVGMEKISYNDSDKLKRLLRKTKLKYLDFDEND